MWLSQLQVPLFVRPVWLLFVCSAFFAVILCDQSGAMFKHNMRKRVQLNALQPFSLHPAGDNKGQKREEPIPLAQSNTNPSSTSTGVRSISSTEQTSTHGKLEMLGANESENGTTSGKSLLQLYEEMPQFREWMKKPYVHGLILPAVIGVMAALSTVCCLCCINRCIRRCARNKRKQRIRNLAEDLKNDKKMLLGAESDDEF